MKIEITTAAQAFSAMGSEHRLAVLIELVRALPGTISTGELQSRLNIAASTLAHHLRFLYAAQLIQQEKKGRYILYSARQDYIQMLASFLMDECCKNTIGNNISDA